MAFINIINKWADISYRPLYHLHHHLSILPILSYSKRASERTDCKPLGSIGLMNVLTKSLWFFFSLLPVLLIPVFVFLRCRTS